MDNKMPLVSYTLAVASGVCFLGGLVILSREGRKTTCTDLRRFYPYSTVHWTRDRSVTSPEAYL